jgi:hypothetical protein
VPYEEEVGSSTYSTSPIPLKKQPPKKARVHEPLTGNGTTGILEPADHLPIKVFAENFIIINTAGLVVQEVGGFIGKSSPPHELHIANPLPQLDTANHTTNRTVHVCTLR